MTTARNVRAAYPVLATILLVLFMSARQHLAHADLEIIESNTPDFKIGDVLNDGTRFRLGVGCRVRALRLPPHETVLFEGPKAPEPPIGGTRSGPLPAPCPPGR
jgi:hypothetical protein